MFQVPPTVLYTLSVLVLSEEQMMASFLSLLQTELTNHTGMYFLHHIGYYQCVGVPLSVVKAGEAEITLSYIIQPLALGLYTVTPYVCIQVEKSFL